ncbi:hypothetical protein HOLleu_20551 [Holothuria leucospilota]|uniref:Uncharacterized protein n=1 Tax=Holothuria leucospilota TaxID=206669 RepID=A0A9Q1BZY9_HOLLE|nr:hypothetical protein HOLleu_20551 [Holothuria leucospilota]
MPWYNSSIHEARRVRTRCENLWRKIRLEVDDDIFFEQKNEVDRLITQAKCDYFKDQLFSATNKKQFCVLNKLLNYGAKVLPFETSHLANRFASFFIEKVKRIRDSMDSHTRGNSHDENELSSSQHTSETNEFVNGQLSRTGQEGDLSQTLFG